MDINSLPISLHHMQFIWFGCFVALLIGYAILDGFDLGVGILHLFSKDDNERRLMLNSIGPVWDGNEVWLVTAGGALFAGFPDIYATVCSAFYVPIIALLTGIIFRAVAIEFRSKQPMAWWRWMWDILFAFASLLIAVGLGFTLGNLINGIKLDENGEFVGQLSDLFQPYALMIAVMTVALFMMHGSIYLMLKTEGGFHDKMRPWVNRSIVGFIMCYAIVTIVTLIYKPYMTEAIKEQPLFFVLAIVNMFAIANIPREIHLGRDGRAFLCSCLNIIILVSLYALGSYPKVVRAMNDPDNLSLTIYNASSSNMTLHILLLIALIGIPMVIAYTSAVYYIFRGKVKLDAHSY